MDVRAAGTRTATTSGTFATSSGYDIDADEGNTNCSGPAARCTSRGPGFAMWGAAMGVDWKPRPSDGDGGYGDKMTYDASKYRGIAFWAKSSAPLDGVQVSFPDLYTDGGGAVARHARSHEPDRSAALHGADWSAGASTTPPPRSTAARTSCSSASRVTRPPTRCSPATRTTSSTPTWKRYQVLFVDTRQDPGQRRLSHRRTTA